MNSPRTAINSIRQAPTVPVLALDVEHHSTKELLRWCVRPALSPRYIPPGTRSVHAIGHVEDEKGSPQGRSGDRHHSDLAPCEDCSDGMPARGCRRGRCRHAVGQPHARYDATVQYDLGADDNIRTALRLARARTVGLWHRSLPRDLVKTSTGFKLEDRDEICCVNQRFVFRAFGGVEITLVCLLTKHLDSCLYWSINTEVDEATRRLRIEAETQRFQEV